MLPTIEEGFSTTPDPISTPFDGSGVVLPSTTSPFEFTGKLLHHRMKSTTFRILIFSVLNHFIKKKSLRT